MTGWVTVHGCILRGDVRKMTYAFDHFNGRGRDRDGDDEVPVVFHVLLQSQICEYVKGLSERWAEKSDNKNTSTVDIPWASIDAASAQQSPLPSPPQTCSPSSSSPFPSPSS